MCVQFHAVRLVITTGPAVGLDYDAQPYTNDDFPEGAPLERYTAKARGRTGAAVRFHVVNSTRDTTERKWHKQRHGR